MQLHCDKSAAFFISSFLHMVFLHHPRLRVHPVKANKAIVTLKINNPLLYALKIILSENNTGYRMKVTSVDSRLFK